MHYCISNLLCAIAAVLARYSYTCHAFLSSPMISDHAHSNSSSTRLHEMQRPILDRLASFLLKLENDRVSSSSVLDEKGRDGEPMEWAQEDSFANKFSQFVSSNELGYRLKQGVADLIAGDYDQEGTKQSIEQFISSSPVAMFSFSTCPFCRTAKDFLDDASIPYVAMELDLLPDNQGNEIRAELGKLTKRTSVPSIFIAGEYIGGCNDGNPGLLPLSRENDGATLDVKLEAAGVKRTVR